MRSPPFGLSVPANTPREIIDRLHKMVEEALQAAAVEPQLMSVEQFGKFFKEDLAATVQLARDAISSRPIKLRL
jgi:tripartite-type tricarboxylate transporter receptor subunit TctC